MMKKTFILCAGLCVALAFTSCGASKESAYRKAYEKAKAQQTEPAGETAETTAPVVTPLQEKPATQTTIINVDNATVRSEDVTVVNGAGLKSFSVIVGSFSLKANAEGLQNTLKSAGYDAQVAYNAGINMSLLLHSIVRLMPLILVIISALSILTHGCSLRNKDTWQEYFL